MTMISGKLYKIVLDFNFLPLRWSEDKIKESFGEPGKVQMLSAPEFEHPRGVYKPVSVLMYLHDEDYDPNTKTTNINETDCDYDPGITLEGQFQSDDNSQYSIEFRQMIFESPYDDHHKATIDDVTVTRHYKASEVPGGVFLVGEIKVWISNNNSLKYLVEAT